MPPRFSKYANVTFERLRALAEPAMPTLFRYLVAVPRRFAVWQDAKPCHIFAAFAAYVCFRRKKTAISHAIVRHITPPPLTLLRHAYVTRLRRHAIVVFAACYLSDKIPPCCHPSPLRAIATLYLRQCAAIFAVFASAATLSCPLIRPPPLRAFHFAATPTRRRCFRLPLLFR
jgi:hypothetical protein